VASKPQRADEPEWHRTRPVRHPARCSSERPGREPAAVRMVEL